MFKTLFTLARGRSYETGERVADANALTILDQQIRDAAGNLDRARRALAIAVAQDGAETRRAESVRGRIADLETRAVAALGGARDDLATEAAEAIAALENDLAGAAASVGWWNWSAAAAPRAPPRRFAACALAARRISAAATARCVTPRRP
jgi:phage shock protein A